MFTKFKRYSGRSLPPSFAPEALDSASNIVTLVALSMYVQALSMFLLRTLFGAPRPFAGGYRLETVFRLPAPFSRVPGIPAGTHSALSRRGVALLPLAVAPSAAAKRPAPPRPAPALARAAGGGVAEAAAASAAAPAVGTEAPEQDGGASPSR